MSEWLEYLIAFLPVIILLVTYFATLIVGSKKNKKYAEMYYTYFKEFAEPYCETMRKIDHQSSQVEIQCETKIPHVDEMSAWLMLLPRDIFPNFLFIWAFKQKDKIGFVLNLKQQPTYEFHLIPYRNQGRIRQNFNTLVMIDDIDTPNKEINDKFLVKSTNERATYAVTQNTKFLNALLKFEDSLEWIRVGKEPPHVELLFKIPSKSKDDFKKIVRFAFGFIKLLK